MNRRYLLTTLFAITVIAGCAPAPVQPQPTVKLTPGYGSDAGNQAVGVIPEASIHDAQRNKNLSVSINYPIYGGPFPIIIFSHGYGGSKNGYEPLASFWTSFGYVVIRPSHADANALREVYENGRVDASEARSQGSGTRGGRGGRGQTPPPASSGAGSRAVARSIEDIWEKEREPQWRDRAADISAVIDSLGDLEQRFPELRGKMDHAKIGVGGHSYGAFTTMLVAGVKPLADPPFSAGDPRVTAAIAMSPQGVSASRGLIPESWKGVTIPMLYMTGSNDNGPAEGEDPAWRRTAYVHSPPGDKYYVEIEGANHMSFTGRLGGFEAPRLADQQRDPMGTSGRGGLASTNAARPNVSYTSGRNTFRYVRDVSLAFWDTYLKGDTKAKDYLQNKVGSDVVKVERK